MPKFREEFQSQAENTDARSLARLRVRLATPISPYGIESAGESARLLDVLVPRFGEPSTHIVCVAMTRSAANARCSDGENRLHGSCRLGGRHSSFGYRNFRHQRRAGPSALPDNFRA